MQFKSTNGLSWRQIIQFRKVSLYQVLRGNAIDFIKETLNYLRTQFPGFPTDFPIKPGIYSTVDFPYQTMKDPANDKNTDKKIHDRIVETINGVEKIHSFISSAPANSPGILPNGIYRYIVRFYNKDDVLGFTVYWQIRIYSVNGELESKSFETIDSDSDIMWNWKKLMKTSYILMEVN